MTKGWWGDLPVQEAPSLDVAARLEHRFLSFNPDLLLLLRAHLSMMAKDGRSPPKVFDEGTVSSFLALWSIEGLLQLERLRAEIEIVSEMCADRQISDRSTRLLGLFLQIEPALLLVAKKAIELDERLDQYGTDAREAPGRE